MIGMKTNNRVEAVLTNRHRDQQAPSENLRPEPKIAFNRLREKRAVRNQQVSGSFTRSPGFRSQPGFSLLECLISLSLGLLILISALEVFSQSRKIFNKLKETQESSLAAVATLEKIREDLEAAGAGLPRRIFDSDLKVLEATGGSLIIFSKDDFLRLTSEAWTAQESLQIELKTARLSSLRNGRALYITDGTKGQLIFITGVWETRLSISPPLSDSYKVGQTEIYLLRKVEIYLDTDQKILRRKVNDTSGQPLMEEVASFESTYDSEKNLVESSLSTESGGKSYEYQQVIYPKNLRKI